MTDIYLVLVNMLVSSLVTQPRHLCGLVVAL